jgi:hypothetical protein
MLRPVAGDARRLVGGGWPSTVVKFLINGFALEAALGVRLSVFGGLFQGSPRAWPPISFAVRPRCFCHGRG